MIRTASTLFLCLTLAACAGKPPTTPGASGSGDEPPMPTGKGTKRALVLVEDKKPDPMAAPIEDQYTTRRIVEKVTSP